MAESAGLGSDAPFRVLTIATVDPRYEAARDVRYRVLYAPWDLSRDLVEDTDGHEYVHFVAVDNDGTVVGYARLHLEAGESQAYQVAVDEARRGRGIGRALMDAVARRARAEGRDFLVLDARERALGFYRRLGYTAEGETFISGRTGTPHRRMRRIL